MKLFSLVLSVTVFFISLYFFVADVASAGGFTDVIYLTLLCILMAICIVGIIINWDFFRKGKRGVS